MPTMSRCCNGFTNGPSCDAGECGRQWSQRSILAWTFSNSHGLSGRHYRVGALEHGLDLTFHILGKLGMSSKKTDEGVAIPPIIELDDGKILTGKPYI